MALGVRAYRQQLIASNIANADTPGYKAVDFDIEEAMRIARSASQVPPTMLTTTSSGHISAAAVSSQPPYPLKYQVPSQDSADGNTVDMDVERTKFSDNSINDIAFPWNFTNLLNMVIAAPVVCSPRPSVVIPRH